MYFRMTLNNALWVRAVAGLAAITLSVLGLATPSSAASSLSAGETSISWNPSEFYEPDGCTRYDVDYSQTSRVLFGSIEVRNRFGDSLSRSSTRGTSGTESLQICSFDYDRADGPFEIVVNSTLSARYGGGSQNNSAPLAFLSRDSSQSPGPIVEQPSSTPSATSDVATIAIEGPQSVNPGSTAKFTVTLRDSARQVISDETVSYSGIGPGLVIGKSKLSDSRGQVEIAVLFSSSDDGIFSLKVEAGTQAVNQTLQISNSQDDDRASGSTNPNVAHIAGQGPDDGEFSAWTKQMANGEQIKFYAKYLQPGQKVQFMVQNSAGSYVEYAWMRVETEDLKSDGSYKEMQNHIYFIRTLDLDSGKNRVRILVDGDLVWGTKTYVP